MLLFLRWTADTRVAWEQEIATMSVWSPWTICQVEEKRTARIQMILFSVATI